MGRVEVTAHGVLRSVDGFLPERHFLDTRAAFKLVEKGALTPFALDGRQIVRARKVEFVTYPWEWTHDQFLEAARLTLDVAEAALAEGYELKDASACNVLFRGQGAEFCDHLSFQPIMRREWWAYGQFIRHFVLPLAISKHRGLPPRDVFLANLDGVSASAARSLLGSKCWTSRIGLALLHSMTAPGESGVPFLSSPANRSKSLHKRLFDFLRWQINGLSGAPNSSIWASYEHERVHYSPRDLDCKREIVMRWLAMISPSWVVDLGSNSGEFSFAAAEIATGGVIAVEADEAALSGLRSKIKSGMSMFTVCSTLDDLANGRGWMGSEYTGLIERLANHSNVTLALALIHHLAIARSIPLEEVANLMANINTEYLIIEYIEPEDKMASRLMRSRDRRDVENFSISAQRDAFEKHFNTLEEIPLPYISRRLALLKRR